MASSLMAEAAEDTLMEPHTAASRSTCLMSLVDCVIMTRNKQTGAEISRKRSVCGVDQPGAQQAVRAGSSDSLRWISVASVTFKSVGYRPAVTYHFSQFLSSMHLLLG